MATQLTTINGIPVYDGLRPGEVIPPTPINSYSALTVPAYTRAQNFKAVNLASFPRAVHRDGAPDAEHYLNKIIKRRPNGYQNAFVFWRTWYFHVGHYWNAYAEVKRAGSRVASLHNLLPEDVAPFRYDADDGEGPQQFYAHLPTKRVLLGSDVLCMSGTSLDGHAGIDPVCLFADTFQQAKTLVRYQTRYLVRGTVIRGAVQIPGTATPEQIEQLRATLRTFTGSESADDVLILSGGATLNNTTLSPQESQLVEQGAQTTKAIAQMTDVHPYYLYDDRDGKYNGQSEQAGIDVVRYTFRPIIEQAEDELTRKLLTEAEQDAGYTIRINPDALLRGDTAAQTQAVISTVNAGLRTKNEGRELLDLPKLDDPDADKLKTLGDTAPPPSTPPAKSSASREVRDQFNMLAPVIAAAVETVETKTAKAFQNHGGKDEQARTIWANVFAEQQAAHVVKELTPVAQTIAALGGQTLDVNRVAQRYAGQVRRRAATGEQTDLHQIITDIGEGEPCDS